MFKHGSLWEPIILLDVVYSATEGTLAAESVNQIVFNDKTEAKQT